MYPDWPDPGAVPEVGGHIPGGNMYGCGGMLDRESLDPEERTAATAVFIIC